LSRAALQAWVAVTPRHAAALILFALLLAGCSTAAERAPIWGAVPAFSDPSVVAQVLDHAQTIPRVIRAGTLGPDAPRDIRPRWFCTWQAMSRNG